MSTPHTPHRLPCRVAIISWSLLTITVFSNSAGALLYRTPEGTLKDNCVVWHDGLFYLFAMYKYEDKPRDQDQWRSVWAATSADGVHWKDAGPVIRDAPFGIYAMKVWRAGDRFLMNHGSFTGEQQDVLRLWESRDLLHWEYLGPEYDIRRPDGQRIDHMDVISVEEDGQTVYYGYAVGGVLRSDNGTSWNWLGELPLSGDIAIRVVQEPGGCERIGDRYYLLVGGFFPGHFAYATATYVGEKPSGPFRPDYPAFRLNGYSGRDLVALWAGYCRTPGALLITNYILDPGGQYWWHAPLKSAVVDGAGHLRMGYWTGNDLLKGTALPCGIEGIQIAAPGIGGAMMAAENHVVIQAPPRPQIRWITPGDPNLVLAYFEPVFNFDKGCVIEGSFKVTARDGLVFPAAGICLEQENEQAVAVLFGTWAETEIGLLDGLDPLDFNVRDRIGPGCASVAGVPAGAKVFFRLLIRKGLFEIYLNDLLVQTYAGQNLTGRIGILAQDGEAVFECPKAWEMTVP